MLPILCFAVYVFSPINYFNHFMGYQSQVHLWLLLFVSACYFLINEVEEWSDLIIGILAGALSIYSMASGVVASFVLIVMVGLLKAIRIRLSRKSSRYAGSYVPALLIVAFLGIAILTWLADYQRPSYHPALVLPYELRFWGHFLNIVALGFGIDQVSNVLGIFCLLIVLAPLVGVVTIYGRNLPIGLWRNLTLTLAILAVLASASAGRAGFGTEQAKDSRNFELAMPLLPLAVVNWSIFLQKRKFLMIAAIASLWVVCFFAFFDNWRQFKYYKREAVRRQIGLKCLKAYYEQKGDGNCPTIFPVPLPPWLLQEAKRLNVSFYRKIASQSFSHQSMVPAVLPSPWVTNVEGEAGSDRSSGAIVDQIYLLNKSLPWICRGQDQFSYRELCGSIPLD
jgi:hypothetical protein